MSLKNTIIRILFWFVIASVIFHVNCDSDSDSEESSSSSESDNEENDDRGDIPFGEHYFNYKEEQYKSGKKKGQMHYTVSLIIPPFVFKKRKDEKNYSVFTCNECQILNKYTKAKATKIEGAGGGAPKYKLIDWPVDGEHECSPSSTNHLVREFLNSLYDTVSKNPTAAVPKIYEDCRTKIFEGLSYEEKETLIQELPCQLNILSGLYKHRQLFIPKLPETYVSIHS